MIGEAGFGVTYNQPIDVHCSQRVLLTCKPTSRFNLAHGPTVPGTHDLYPTIDDCQSVVHMEGSNIPRTNIDSTEAEGTRRLGLN